MPGPGPAEVIARDRRAFVLQGPAESTRHANPQEYILCIIVDGGCGTQVISRIGSDAGAGEDEPATGARASAASYRASILSSDRAMWIREACSRACRNRGLRSRRCAFRRTPLASADPDKGSRL